MSHNPSYGGSTDHIYRIDSYWIRLLHVVIPPYQFETYEIMLVEAMMLGIGRGLGPSIAVWKPAGYTDSLRKMAVR